MEATIESKGKQAAARFLERKGMEILARDWACEQGIADIVARDGDGIHIVEVKTRGDAAHGFPSEDLGAGKRLRYERIAMAYLAQSDLVDVGVSFDIVSIVVTGERRAFLRYHKNAFAGSAAE